MNRYFDMVSQFRARELYGFIPNILILYEANFEKVLTRSPYTWIVTFYSPDCASCRRMVSVNSELAELAAKGTNTTRVAVVNCQLSFPICQHIGMNYMGQMFFIPQNQSESGGYIDKISYEGPKIPEKILEASAQLPQSSVVQMNSLQQLLSDVEATATKVSPIKTVAGIWLVDFWRPSCPPCRTVKSALRELAQELDGVVKLVTIDCDANHCPGIGSFPSFRLVIKRSTGHVEVRDFDYDPGKHPAVGAIRVAGYVLKEVLGLAWSSESTKRQNDEL